MCIWRFSVRDSETMTRGTTSGLGSKDRRNVKYWYIMKKWKFFKMWDRTFLIAKHGREYLQWNWITWSASNTMKWTSWMRWKKKKGSELKTNCVEYNNILKQSELVGKVKHQWIQLASWTISVMLDLFSTVIGVCVLSLSDF